MTQLGDRSIRRLLNQLLRGRTHAYITTGPDGAVIDVQGELGWFGLEGLEPGELLEERVVALQELETAQGSDLLPRIELVSGRSTDLHILQEEEQTTIFFLDVTDEAQREHRFQERGNHLSLMLHALGVAVFEQRRDGSSSLVSLKPAWMHALMPGADDPVACLPFLENFLVDAEEVWAGRSVRIAWSGQWIEEDDQAREWILEATAARLDNGRRLLVVQLADHRHEERLHILQEARSRTLDFDRLRREIDKKEILLHCIVHDLKGPLSSMVGSMSLIKSRPLTPERARDLLELGLGQARYQESMIRGILDAFSAEIDALEHFESNAEDAPDLIQCVNTAADTYRPACEQSRVRLEVQVADDLADRVPVVGEASRLSRVICNLLENALRNSPPGGELLIRVQEASGALRVFVEDEGPGVPEKERLGLFERMTQGTSARGAAGLGLYFCRSTLEMWGGTVGYEDRDSGGARFWFRLLHAR